MKVVDGLNLPGTTPRSGPVLQSSFAFPNFLSRVPQTALSLTAFASSFGLCHLSFFPYPPLPPSPPLRRASWRSIQPDPTKSRLIRPNPTTSSLVGCHKSVFHYLLGRSCRSAPECPAGIYETNSLDTIRPNPTKSRLIQLNQTASSLAFVPFRSFLFSSVASVTSCSIFPFVGPSC